MHEQQDWLLGRLSKVMDQATEIVQKPALSAHCSQRR